MEKVATPSVTKAIIRKYNLSLRKSLGQNFLIEPKFIDKIVETIPLTEKQVVVEIGPGIGALTQALAEKGHSIIAIEIDRHLIPILNDTFHEYKNVHIVHGDALKIDFDQLVAENNGGRSDAAYQVVGNLPYYITTPLIMYLLEQGFKFSSLVLMVQKEVAQRINAQPGTKDYGALSIGVQYYCRTKLVQQVPPTVFYPRPEVDSAIIRLEKRLAPAVEVLDEGIYFSLVKAAFNQRRKTLLNALTNSTICAGLSKKDWLDVLTDCSIDPKRRGETLNLQEFAILANKLVKDKY